RVEVGAGGEDLDVPAREVDRDDGVRGLAVPCQRLRRVVLADGQDPASVAIRREVGEPPAGAVSRERLEATVGVDPVEAPAGEVGDEDKVVVDEVRAAAVLVDAVAGVEALWRQPGLAAVGITPDEDLAAFLLGPSLEPPADPVDRADLAEDDRALRQQLDRERRGPGPEGRRAAA